MCTKASLHQTSHRFNGHPVQNLNSIGQLFRDYGEDYISGYQPSGQQIKLIRAIRVCRTPVLGWHIIRCKDCCNQKYVYNSCGHSQCMICQSIKREQWVDKLKSSLLEVPYVHCVFTLPHQLNGLARANKSEMYSMLLKSSWKAIYKIGQTYGATPGMSSVLHTFGSDLKYHIHVHALVTFGGLKESGEWEYPKHKYKLDKFRSICAIFKRTCMESLRKQVKANKLSYHSNIEPLLSEVSKIRWVVHSTRPTMNTSLIENYLGRYINRIAVSSSRMKYIEEQQQVQLIYNDYKNQQPGMAAPKLIKILKPLEAIHQILQHVLPGYFQKSRNYGLHHHSTVIKQAIPPALKRNPMTIRTVFQILHQLLQINPYQCSECGSDNYKIIEFAGDKSWWTPNAGKTTGRSPPGTTQNRSAFTNGNSFNPNQALAVP